MYDVNFRQVALALAILISLTALFIDRQTWQMLLDSVRAYW